MYWYKLRNYTLAALTGGLLLFSFACKPDIKETGATLNYFDLKGYFINDTARLNHSNIPVDKTVTHNGIAETKTVHIDNWGRELDLFIASDINKPAWKNSYSVTTTGDFLIYKAKDPDLKTREVMIKKDRQKVKWILIFNYTKNALYQTTEKLTYFPDSLYLIQKKQQVRLIGTNIYTIKGVFKK